MCESEYLVLSEWFNYLVSSPQLDFHVDRIIYLRTDPEVAYERIQKRNRMEENKIPFQLVKGKSTKVSFFLIHGTIQHLVVKYFLKN
jgi:thymidylate kinase